MQQIVDALVGGLELFLVPSFWVAVIIGVLFGVITGALPGLGTTLAYALILPFTYGLDITTTIALLMAVTVGVQYGNSIPAILIGVPGTPAAVLTVIDGFALHKQGKTGYALGVAFVAALSGQFVSILFFAAAVVPLGALAFHFLNPELFALFVFGIVAIVSLTGKNLIKGLMAACIGLLIAIVGLDPVNFQPRFTFDFRELQSGLNASAAVIGLLAVSELLRQTRQAFQWDTGGTTRFSATFPPLRALRRTFPAMAGGTVVGTLVGAIPGAGATPAALISYQQAQIFSKKPAEFGRGSPEGIAANEAAQNASSSGELIPTLGLGIPGSGSMVLLLAALTLNGFVPGPGLVRDYPELLAAVVGGLLGATIFLVLTGWAMAKGMLKLLTIDRSLVIVAALFTVVMGVYSLNYKILDVLVCFGCGALGYFMLRYGYSTAAAALAVVLAAGLEGSLRRGLSLFDDDVFAFVGRPITAVILTLAMVFLAIGLRRTLQESRRNRQEIAGQTVKADQAENAEHATKADL